MDVIPNNPVIDSNCAYELSSGPEAPAPVLRPKVRNLFGRPSRCSTPYRPHDSAYRKLWWNEKDQMNMASRYVPLYYFNPVPSTDLMVERLKLQSFWSWVLRAVEEPR